MSQSTALPGESRSSDAVRANLHNSLSPSKSDVMGSTRVGQDHAAGDFRTWPNIPGVLSRCVPGSRDLGARRPGHRSPCVEGLAGRAVDTSLEWLRRWCGQAGCCNSRFTITGVAAPWRFATSENGDGVPGSSRGRNGSPAPARASRISGAGRACLRGNPDRIRVKESPPTSTGCGHRRRSAS